MANSAGASSRSATAVRDTGESRFGRGGSERLQSTEERQREQFGGLHWGSAFFGWLVAIGIAALLIAILSAAGEVRHFQAWLPVGYINPARSSREQTNFQGNTRSH